MPTFSTGIGSPVISDSSHAERPSTTRPSTGIFSPAEIVQKRFSHEKQSYYSTIST